MVPVEIFDMTLAMLSIKDLLRCERVCTDWCILIRDGYYTSMTLFRYRKTMEEQNEPSGRHNFLEKKWKIHHNDRSTTSKPLDDYVAHPLLARFIGIQGSCSITFHDNLKLPYISRWHLLPTINRRNGLPNPEASWRQMFITWPPLKEIELHVSYRLHDDQPNQEEPKVIKILEPEGITLNHFFYALSGSAMLKWGRTASSIMEWNKTITKSWFTRKYRGMRIRVVPIIEVKKDGPKTAARRA